MKWTAKPATVVIEVKGNYLLALLKHLSEYGESASVKEVKY